jgi:hypothetical protein
MHVILLYIIFTVNFGVGNLRSLFFARGGVAGVFWVCFWGAVGWKKCDLNNEFEPGAESRVPGFGCGLWF